MSYADKIRSQTLTPQQVADNERNRINKMRMDCLTMRVDSIIYMLHKHIEKEASKGHHNVKNYVPTLTYSRGSNDLSCRTYYYSKPFANYKDYSEHAGYDYYFNEKRKVSKGCHYAYDSIYYVKAYLICGEWQGSYSDECIEFIYIAKEDFAEFTSLIEERLKQDGFTNYYVRFERVKLKSEKTNMFGIHKKYYREQLTIDVSW